VLKKRIYLPENCKMDKCPIYKQLVAACIKCVIYQKSKKERSSKLTDAHRQASNRYYHKKKLESKVEKEQKQT